HDRLLERAAYDFLLKVLVGDIDDPGWRAGCRFLGHGRSGRLGGLAGLFLVGSFLVHEAPALGGRILGRTSRKSAGFGAARRRFSRTGHARRRMLTGAYELGTRPSGAPAQSRTG